MNPTRRKFLHRLALGSACLGLSGLVPSGRLLAFSRAPAKPPQKQSLKLLILGGTGFLGPHTVRSAIARGHEMTLFNRGKTNLHLFPELEKLRGDRKNDLHALAGRTWDAVIDTSGYVPRHVRMSTEILAPNVQQYIFISTKSVYASFARTGMDETAALATLDDPATEEVTRQNWGPLKALCEQVAEEVMPGRVVNIRPGLIAGPGDRSDRFTYWPWRVRRGGEILTPGDGSDYLQFIDARDLGEWIITCIENQTVGVFNAVRPGGTMTMKKLIDACGEVLDVNASCTWTAADFLARHNVEPWVDMPCWMPPEPENKGFACVSTAKAEAAGLKHRGVKATIGDTINWFAELSEERRHTLRAGLSKVRERDLLAAWHAERG